MNITIDKNILLIIGGIVLLYFIYKTKIIQFYLLAKFSNIKISLLDLIFMRIRRVNIEIIVQCMITLDKERISVNKFDMETHYLAGGDLSNVCKGLINAKRNNLELDFKVASNADLRKLNLVKVIDNWKLNHPDEKAIKNL